MAFLVYLLSLAWTFCFSSQSLASPSAATELEIKLYLTVDWEGVDFRTPILDASDILPLQAFRAAFPQYPMIHYLNAAYYTNGSLSDREVTQRIRRVLLPGDQIGLHIHPWESLTSASGVPFRSSPSYFDFPETPNRGTANKKFPHGHRGGDVPLWAYAKKEIRALIRYSIRKLQEQGFSSITSFRAGGWQTDHRVLDVLAEMGFQTESSPMAQELVARLYPNTSLAANVKKLWPGITPTSQPFQVVTDSNQTVTLVPNNAGLADYVDAQKFREILWQNVHEAKKRGKKTVHLVYGFHLETAAEYLPRVRQAILSLEAEARKHNWKITPATYEQKFATSCRSLLQKH